MTRIRNIQFLSGLLCILLIGGFSFSLTSCIKDAEPPFMESTGSGDKDDTDSDNDGEESDDEEGEGEGEGDENEPDSPDELEVWSVSEALAQLADGFNGEAIVTGIITSVKSFNENYGSITYFIGETVDATNTLQIYGGLSFNGEKFASINAVEVGATVKVKGTLKMYNTTPEMDLNNVLLEYVGPNGETPEEPGENDPEDNPEEKPEGEIPGVFEDMPYGYVVLPSGIAQQYVAYTGFSLSYNKDTHNPNYVSWELTSEETKGTIDRNDYGYWQDEAVIGCPPVVQQWYDSGYDRGHQCPAADMKWSAQAMRDCMSMANMCPQISAFNQGIWAKLEDKEREWANKLGSVMIVCGPIFTETDQKYLGSYQTRVPGAFFKAFLYVNGSNSRAIAFAFVNGSNPGNYQSYAMSIDDLEEETGYDFFSLLPDDIEEAVEKTFDISQWN